MVKAYLWVLGVTTAMGALHPFQVAGQDAAPSESAMADDACGQRDARTELLLRIQQDSTATRPEMLDAPLRESEELVRSAAALGSLEHARRALEFARGSSAAASGADAARRRALQICAAALLASHFEETRARAERRLQLLRERVRSLRDEKARLRRSLEALQNASSATQSPAPTNPDGTLPESN